MTHHKHRNGQNSVMLYRRRAMEESVKPQKIKNQATPDIVLCSDKYVHGQTIKEMVHTRFKREAG